MVVAFHAGLPVPGGFVGVDVFFVISGFVITGMLLREWSATGRVSLGAFYVRRFKRLAPALALMVGVTAIVSSLVLSPLGAQQTAAETGAGAMLLVANWVIAGATGGYFDASAETNPLLNTWTLSVEEQFYLAFPAILALAWVVARRFRLAPLAVVGFVAAISFVLADIGSTGYASSWLLGFYSPLTRAWEFAVGSLVALAAPKLAQGLRSGLGLAGIGLLAASLWLIGADTPSPGMWTLLPVAGAALVILAGVRGSTLMTRVLAARPLATIGDHSYSIYLWHWPFIVFASLLWPESSYAPVAAAAASLLPAIASYRWVEQPIRALDRLTAPRLAALIAVVVVAPVLVAGAVGATATSYWTPRYEAGQVAVANEGDIGQAEWHRHLRAHFYPCTPKQMRDQALSWHGLLRCQQSKPGADVSVAVIGDSHAEHLFPGLAEALPARNVAFYIRNDPLTMKDREVARIVRHVAANPRIDTVVVSALWNLRGVHPVELAGMLKTLSVAGKTVFVTDDVPYFPFEPFRCKYRQALFLPTDCAMDAGTFRRDYALWYPELVATVRGVPRAHMVNTARHFCGEDTCEMARGGTLLFRDRSHLNIRGSEFLGRRMLDDQPILAAALARPQP